MSSPALSKSPERDNGPAREYVEAAHVSVVVAGALLGMVAWAALIWLVRLSGELPTVPNRWNFFALLQIALTGTTLPFVRLLHQRFSRDRALYVAPGVLVRQAIWVGLLGTIFAWLQIPRLLSLPLAVVLIIALVIIESLLRLRERMQWRPQ